jgi:hypothetical protein
MFFSIGFIDLRGNSTRLSEQLTRPLSGPGEEFAAQVLTANFLVL